MSVLSTLFGFDQNGRLLRWTAQDLTALVASGAGLVRRLTLTGDLTLTTADVAYQFLDPGAADRVVTLAAQGNVAIRHTGVAHTLTVKNAGGTTVAVMNPNDPGLSFVYDGTNWNVFGGAGAADLTHLDANNLTQGVVPAGRLPASMTLSGLTIGGATVTKILTATATLTMGPVAPGGIFQAAIPLTGVAPGDAVFLASPEPPNGCVYSAHIAQTNSVTVSLLNADLLSTVEPGDQLFRVVVIKF